MVSVLKILQQTKHSRQHMFTHLFESVIVARPNPTSRIFLCFYSSLTYSTVVRLRLRPLEPFRTIFKPYCSPSSTLRSFHHIHFTFSSHHSFRFLSYRQFESTLHPSSYRLLHSLHSNGIQNDHRSSTHSTPPSAPRQ
jgi:hypothetical protein